MLTRGQLKELVTYWVDDLQKGYFTDDQLNRFLNDALFEVQKELVLAGENWYLTCAETQTVLNQADYALPTDFLKLNRLEILGPNQTSTFYPLQSITLNQQDLIAFNTSGTPEAYYLKKFRAVLVPAPDSVKTLRLYYTYRVTEMTADSNVPDVPEEYQEWIALVAAYNCFIKDDRNPSNLLEKMSVYKKMLASTAEERTVDSPRQVVVTTDGGFGSLF